MLTHCLSLQDSDGEKSDDNLVVDVSNEVSMFCQFLLLVSFFFKLTTIYSQLYVGLKSSIRENSNITFVQSFCSPVIN